MATAEIRLKTHILRARNNIRRKFRALKRTHTDSELLVQKHLKSPLEAMLQLSSKSDKPRTLSKATQTIEKEEEVEDEEGVEDVFTPVKSSSQLPQFLKTSVIAESPSSSKEPTLSEVLATPEQHARLKNILVKNFGTLVSPYLEGLFTKKTDTTYGIRYEEERFRIGDSDITIKDKFLIVRKVRYQLTDGLLELLFSRAPLREDYTKEDLDKYKSILIATNAFRRNYKRSEPVNANKSTKYRTVISQLFPTQESVRRGHSASGVTFKALKPFVDVAYWNDPNKLVKRLQLLKASQQAGHTGHVGELLEIEEELRHAGIIV